MSPSTHARGVAAALALLLVATSVAGASVAATAQSSNTSLVTVDDTVRVHSTAEATVEGTTDLPAGTNLTVRVRSAGDTSPRFFRSVTVPVADDGTFAATFDFSAYAPGDTFTVTVARNGSEVASAEGRVVAGDVAVSPSPTPTATATGTATETSLPGFGVGAMVTALVAAAGAAALAARRRTPRR